jgi:hypothetical protein
MRCNDRIDIQRSCLPQSIARISIRSTLLAEEWSNYSITDNHSYKHVPSTIPRLDIRSSIDSSSNIATLLACCVVSISQRSDPNVTDNLSETADGSTLFEAAHHMGILSKLANPDSSKRSECVSFAELGVGKSPSKIGVMLERGQFGAFRSERFDQRTRNDFRQRSTLHSRRKASCS